MNPQQTIFQFGFGILVIDGDLDLDLPAKVTVSSFDAQVFGDVASGWALPLESRNYQRSFIPGDLHIGSVDTRHLGQNNDFIRAFTDVYVRNPCGGLVWLLLEFEVL
jgi:hypothetical protein